MQNTVIINVEHQPQTQLQENKEALTIAEVQEKVDYFRNELDANFAVNGHVVDQYKRRLEMVGARRMPLEQAGISDRQVRSRNWRQGRKATNGTSIKSIQ